MLVLQRHIDQRIMIGNDVIVTVIDIQGDHVRLGIEAPIEISIDREEIREAKDRERRAEPDGGPGPWQS